MFCKKICFIEFLPTGKDLCQSLFLKNRLQYRCFPVKLMKFLITSFLEEKLPWLLLNFVLKLEAANRCSHPQMFSKKGELKDFPKFLGKHLHWLTLLQKDLQGTCVLVSFAKFSRTTILKNTWQTAASMWSW